MDRFDISDPKNKVPTGTPLSSTPNVEGMLIILEEKPPERLYEVEIPEEPKPIAEPDYAGVEELLFRNMRAREDIPAWQRNFSSATMYNMYNNTFMNENAFRKFYGTL